MGRSRSSSSVSKRRYFNPVYLPQETKALGFALHCLCCCFPLRLGSPDSCSCNMRILHQHGDNWLERDRKWLSSST
ncbi:hypothetical protein K2173_019997 [Erythroxylum novogranatense]|uniref:Uncharacterized protein n=1 Tax=Erythroxylum novogranatense TaxID=1862640 RepID=A0AAV8UB18_9ROSI|nr:hypothetical protein K2173_019997 [Erythroxylum novogranatense]